MITDSDFADKIECVAAELLAFAEEMRHAVEGGWRWSPATYAAKEAVKEISNRETESSIPA